MYAYFDGHCDTLKKIYLNRGSLSDASLDVNIKALNRYKPVAQCFSLFNDGKFKISDFSDAALVLKRECENLGIKFCVGASDIDRAIQSGCAAALLTAEGLGNTPDFVPKDICRMKKWGYSMAGIVWNYDNQLAGGAYGTNCGITQEGAKTLRYMEKCGIIIDVSHMSDRSFWDTAEFFCKPIAASHSNSRFVCNDKRNLTDEQIKAVIHSEGVIGINLYPPFVSKEAPEPDCLLAHIDRVVSLGGSSSVCIGADFDGIDEAVLRDVSMLFKIISRHNYPKKFIYDFGFNNLYNIYRKYEI